MRVVVGSDVTVTCAPFVDADGVPADADSLPSVSVVDFAGESMTAPDAVGTTENDGLYTAVLSHLTHTASLNLLQVTFTGTVDGLMQTQTVDVEVCGGYYASVASIRAMDGLGSPGTYPTDRIMEVRDEFESLVDLYRGTAYVPRLRVETVRHPDAPPTGTSRRHFLGGQQWWTSILLSELHPRALRAIWVGDTSQDMAPWLLTDYGLLYSDTAHLDCPANEQITVVYEYGYDQPPPGLQRACREYVRSVLLKESSGISRDVISQSFEGMITRYSSPDMGAGRPTGWTEVDRLLNSLLDERVPAMA